MELLTQSKAIRVPVFVYWKKLAIIKFGDWARQNGEVERQARFISKARQGALYISWWADFGQNKEGS